MSSHHAIADLLYEYAEHIDNNDFDAWLTLFVDEASYRAVPRENYDRNLPVSLIYCANKNMIRDRIVSLREANEYNLHFDRHLITNVRFEPIAQMEWSVRSNYLVVQTDMGGNSQLFSTGRYVDRVIESDGRLRFVEKLVIIDSFSVPTLLATPL